VAWNPDATCPGFDAFLSEVLPADAQRFIREVIGHTIVPDGFLRKAVMLLGTGSNVKSTIRALRSV
jgi:phage/plasmid-associated DNA primase